MSWNQTLAENLRNNFAPREKLLSMKQKAGSEVDIAALQTELDEYIAGYSWRSSWWRCSCR